jgi:hypothetical protein
MTRRYIYVLTGITLVVVFLMAFLHFNANNPKQRKHGFNRAVFKSGLVKLHSVNQSIVDVAGMHAGKLYLVTKDPGELLVTDTAFQNKQTIQLMIAVTNQLRSNFTTTLLDSFVYIAGHNVPSITRYDLSTQTASEFKTDRAFSRFALLNDQSAALRGFNASFDDELFRKVNMPTATYIEEKDITDKTAGGGFVTDGMLHYDKRTGRVVYNFFYCNRLLFLDTNLNLLQTGNTIDTFKTYTAGAKAVRTTQGVSYTFSKPPELLSLHSCVSDGKLFIYSRLKADNDETEIYKNHTVIDVYDILSGKYDGSLYVPGKRMLKFRVFDNRLYAIYPDALVTYQLTTLI